MQYCFFFSFFTGLLNTADDETKSDIFSFLISRGPLSFDIVLDYISNLLLLGSFGFGYNMVIFFPS